MIMNQKGYGGKRWLHHSIHYIRICLKELRNAVKIPGKPVVSSILESGTCWKRTKGTGHSPRHSFM